MSKKPEKPLFTLTRKDFDWQYFRAGGKGGQHQNKTDSAVRVIHRPSGATGESRTERSQFANRKLALRRLGRSKKFQLWIKLKSSEIIGQRQTIKEKVKQQMNPSNLKLEGKTESGQWEEMEIDPREIKEVLHQSRLRRD